MKPEHEQILKIVGENPGILTSELANMVGVSMHLMSFRVSDLLFDGKISKASKFDGYYLMAGRKSKSIANSAFKPIARS